LQGAKLALSGNSDHKIKAKIIQIAQGLEVQGSNAGKNENYFKIPRIT